MIKKLYAVLSKLENWCPLTDGRGFEDQLKKEIVEGHKLYGLDLFAIGKSESNNDVLFVSTNKYYLIHLTWGLGTEQFPLFEEFDKLVDLKKYIFHCQRQEQNVIDNY